eukprot:TRINITY_DN1416_c0_g1_i2.p1 TRINITY_DN1416_c0_g1~~TRINITY_DN1416_c0_g1_i2.p1  ORF type:complete len:316 (+),score=34.82 TRINITY_DN1416_c0_g1_i2:97-948(+)
MSHAKPYTDSIEVFNQPLKQGVKIPRIGLGVFQSAPGPETEEAVACALQEGYRHIDTAALYRNEASVGAAIRNSGIPREEIFVTTKLWNSDHGYQQTLQAFQRSLVNLGLEYVDLYLVHSPMRVDKRLETWKAMETILKSGRARSIGVSNYGIHHLEELFANCTIRPSVNQVELHPYHTRTVLVDFCKRNGIALQAYSPLTKGRRLKDPALQEIAHRYHKTPAQLLLRWGLQKGFIVLPKSVTPQRILQNIQVTDFEISATDMAQLDSFNENLATGWDPTTGA